MPSTYTLISSNVLASSAASVTFSAIPSTYTDLVVRASIRSDATSDADDRPSAETRGPCEYELYGPSPTEEEDIHSEGTDPVLPLITQTITPRGPMLTDSDEELLRASEHYEAQQRTPVTHDFNIGYYDIPLDYLHMNNYAPQPTIQDFNEALALPIEEWASNIIRKTPTPSLQRF